MSFITENELENELENIQNETPPIPEERVGIQVTRQEELDSFIRNNDPALILRMGFLLAYFCRHTSACILLLAYFCWQTFYLNK